MVLKVFELCARYFFRRRLPGQSGDEFFGREFAALYLFHGRSKREAQLGVGIH